MMQRDNETNVQEFTMSSGNVFEDIGLENADELLVKVDLMHAISREITRRGITQQEAAILVGETQPNISRIFNGKLDAFSQERLIDILRHLAMDVEIRIQPRHNGRLGTCHVLKAA